MWSVVPRQNTLPACDKPCFRILPFCESLTKCVIPGSREIQETFPEKIRLPYTAGQTTVYRPTAIQSLAPRQARGLLSRYNWFLLG